ncbi:MAG: hypothetical protein OXT09_29395 [Myxococcales bacterium]|nr:hypothetical protein [Myxococcales bacterium]
MLFEQLVEANQVLVPQAREAAEHLLQAVDALGGDAPERLQRDPTLLSIVGQVVDTHAAFTELLIESKALTATGVACAWNAGCFRGALIYGVQPRSPSGIKI